jgi:hypothetical protein
LQEHITRSVAFSTTTTRSFNFDEVDNLAQLILVIVGPQLRDAQATVLVSGAKLHILSARLRLGASFSLLIELESRGNTNRPFFGTIVVILKHLLIHHFL